MHAVLKRGLVETFLVPLRLLLITPWKALFPAAFSFWGAARGPAFCAAAGAHPRLLETSLTHILLARAVAAVIGTVVVLCDGAASASAHCSELSRSRVSAALHYAVRCVALLTHCLLLKAAVYWMEGVGGGVAAPHNPCLRCCLGTLKLPAVAVANSAGNGCGSYCCCCMTHGVLLTESLHKLAALTLK